MFHLRSLSPIAAFLFDNWLGEHCLADELIGAGCAELDHLAGDRVANFLGSDGWDRLSIEAAIPIKRLVQRILCVPIFFNSRDRPIIKSNVGGTTSAKIASTLPSPESILWAAKCWDNRITPSMSIFNWRFRFNFIPIDDILKLKGIALPSICLLCHNNEESIAHSFFSCTFAAKVWSTVANFCELDITLHHLKDFESCLQVWTHNRGKQHLYSLIPLIVFWFVWMARNHSKYSGDTCLASVTATHVITFVIKLVCYSRSPWKLLSSSDGLRTKLHLPHLPNPPGIPRTHAISFLGQPWIKLNMGGFYSNVYSGFGGIIRDSLPQFHAMFHLRSLSPIAAFKLLCSNPSKKLPISA